MKLFHQHVLAGAGSLLTRLQRRATNISILERAGSGADANAYQERIDRVKWTIKFMYDFQLKEIIQLFMTQHVNSLGIWDLSLLSAQFYCLFIEKRRNRKSFNWSFSRITRAISSYPRTAKSWANARPRLDLHGAVKSYIILCLDCKWFCNSQHHHTNRVVPACRLSILRFIVPIIFACTIQLVKFYQSITQSVLSYWSHISTIIEFFILENDR